MPAGAWRGRAGCVKVRGTSAECTGSEGSASDRLLDTYQAERRPVASEVVRKTSRDWNILIGHTVLNRLLRDHVLLPLLRLPAMQRRWLEAGSQLRVSYRGGPLAEITIAERLSSLFRDAPLAGDRAPSAACRLTPSGEATTLGRLTGAGWAPLLFGQSARDRRACAAAARAYLNGVRVILVLPAESDGNPAEPFEADAVAHDNDGAVARAYRPGRRSAILLRPDGHIALRASRRASERLAAWLYRALGADNVRYPTERPAINQNAFFAGFGAHSRQ
ncbi:MAG TPA: hypothetical protein VGR45_16410 [Stellaceae bacterium]|nr:hypothetical protein [Stellaceae bacterium]